ncbi:MAG TPA: cysteine--tRNA ligase, partial [Methanothermococcus okinawensis]|nr:cysteine--tRNA ligase [Methanothermococcus okinawensis]
MTMKIYNTLTKKKEEFIPLEKPVVKMYICGPTVYDNAHLGHGRTYVAFDLIRRYLEHRNYIVRFVMNFTDIDDKIIDRSKREGIPIEDLTNKYIRSFLEDMDKLKVKGADVYPRVSEHIDDIIEFIEVLIEKGYAYVSKGGVYFHVRKFKDYGKL